MSINDIPNMNDFYKEEFLNAGKPQVGNPPIKVSWDNSKLRRTGFSQVVPPFIEPSDEERERRLEQRELK